MCKERMYRSNCRERHINSYEPRQFDKCRNPENFPDCKTGNAIIDDVDVRDHTYKRCVKILLPANMNYAAEVTAYASSAYRVDPGDQVPRPPEYLRRWFPRSLSAAATEPEGNQAEVAPEVEPNIPPEITPAVTDFDEEARESVHAPSHLHVPSLHSPAPSSSTQRTGVICTGRGEIYPHTVYDSFPENPDWVETVEGEQYVFETVETDPGIQDVEPWIREELRSDLEFSKKIVDWSDGIQKKTSSERE